MVRSAAPRITSTARGKRYSHRELVLSNVAFPASNEANFNLASSLFINPGLASTFPWLAPIAIQFEQYVFHRLTLEWIPIAPTSTQGDVYIVPVYDASGSPPTTETQAANNMGAVTNSVWKGFAVHCDPAGMRAGTTRKFVRDRAVAGDLKTYDSGQIFVCTNNGNTASQAAGKLFVNYDVEFFVPNSDNLVGTLIPTATSQFDVTGSQTLTTATGTNVIVAPFVDRTSGSNYDPLKWWATWSSANNNFTPPAGVYRLDFCGTVINTASSNTISSGVSVLKNGASFPSAAGGSPVVTNSAEGAGNGAGDTYLPQVISTCIACNGSDTVAIAIAATFSAGTTTINSGQLLVSMA
jgi:hypothetical protein